MGEKLAFMIRYISRNKMWLYRIMPIFQKRSVERNQEDRRSTISENNCHKDEIYTIQPKKTRKKELE